MRRTLEMYLPQDHTAPSSPPAPAVQAGFDYVVLLAKLGSAVAAALDEAAVYRPCAASASR